MIKTSKAAIVSFLSREIKSVKRLHEKSVRACPDHRELSLAIDRKFLGGLSIGHWEGRLAALQEINQIIERQL